MRVAIFSDVHGNLTAFEAVLADIKREEPDLIFFAGDLCLFGARPKECLDLLRDENIPAVYGNTDCYLTDRPSLPEPKTAEAQQQRNTFNQLLDWTTDQLGELNLAYMFEIPFHRRVSPSIDPHDDLFIVHANPIDVEQPIHPTEPIQQQLYQEIKQPDDDQELTKLLSDLDTGILAFGHVHIPNIRIWNGRHGSITLANISSVSLPLDGDNRAKYGLFSWDKNSGWTISHHYVNYDLDQERSELAQAKPPNWESLSQRLG